VTQQTKPNINDKTGSNLLCRSEISHLPSHTVNGISDKTLMKIISQAER